MSQVLNRTRDAIVLFGIEASFGTLPSMARCWPVVGSLEFAPDQAENENLDLTEELLAYQAPVKGNQGGTLKWSAYFRPDSTQLDSTATATPPWLVQMLYACFGGVFPAIGSTTVGSTVATATSASSFAVAAAAGTKFKKGTFVLPTVNAAYEPGYVTNISTDTLTVTPALSATPSTTGILQMWNLAPNQNHSTTFSLQVALASNTVHQWQFTGCVMTGLDLEVTNGGLVKLTFSAKIGAWTGPASLSIPVSYVAQPMSPPVAARGGQMMLQPTATTTYPLSWYSAPKLAFKLTLGTDHLPDLSGLEGKAGALRTGTDDRLFAEVTVTAYPDISGGATVPDATWWTNRTPLQFWYRVPIGAGTARRWIVIALPTCIVVGKPKFNASAVAGAAAYDITLRGQITQTVTSGTLGDPFERGVALLAAG